MDKSKQRIIPSVKHHRQNTMELYHKETIHFSTVLLLFPVHNEV